MCARCEQKCDERSDRHQPQSQQRDETARWTDLALHLAAYPRAERDALGEARLTATTHGQRIVVTNDGLNGQRLAVRRDPGQTTHGGADGDDFDQAWRQLADLQAIADYAFRAHRGGLVFQQPQAVFTRAVNELGEFAKLAFGQRGEARADPAAEAERVDA